MTESLQTEQHKSYRNHGLNGLCAYV